MYEKTNVEQEKLSDIIDKHAKVLRDRIEDNNTIINSTNELMRETNSMISEFYDKFKQKFPE